jgi:hypothetical protein
MSLSIHLVAFNNPYPPDYGGVIDVFYKIKALHEAGIGINLHVFEYGRKHSAELEKLCQQIYYYERPRGIRYQLSTMPFIVVTRKNKTLLDNLLADNAPILFEGLHCTAWLNHPLLANRQKVVRTHNIEHDYYTKLSHREKNWLKKSYFSLEAIKLKHYEPVLKYASGLASIAQGDEQYFKKINTNTLLVGAFHPFKKIVTQAGSGQFILYHGKLEVAENNEAACFILDKVLPNINYPSVIAGKNPPEWFRRKIEATPQVSLVADPDNETMEALIRDAHIHLLPTFQPTGLKLKLLYSLFAGRHVVVNPTMVEGSGLDSLCHVCNTAKDMHKTIKGLIYQPFDIKELEQRKQILEENFSNIRNTQRLLSLLFPKQD